MARVPPNHQIIDASALMILFLQGDNCSMFWVTLAVSLAGQRIINSKNSCRTLHRNWHFDIVSNWSAPSVNSLLLNILHFIKQLLCLLYALSLFLYSQVLFLIVLFSGCFNKILDNGLGWLNVFHTSKYLVVLSLREK